MPDNNHMDFGVDLLPVTDKEYSLGKSDKRWKIFADEIDGTIKANNVIPILSQNFTTGKYGQDGSGTHYYETLGTITPDTFEKMWLLHYIISIEVPNDSTYTYRADVSFYGVRNTYGAYKVFNSYYNKYPIYQHALLEGASSSYPHEFGYRLASSYGDTTLNKNITIEIIETRNCTVSFFDSPKAYTSATPTNYTWRGFNATSNGLQETGDADTITRLYAGNNTMKTSTTMRLAGSSLYGFDRDNRAQTISLYSSGYTSNTTSINTARVYNDAGFDWTKGLFYNTGGNYATDTDIYPGIDQSIHAIDFRYTDNCVNSSSLSTLGLERYKAVYFRGTLGSDGLFYLAPITVTYNSASYKRAWTQDIPSSEDGYVYWFIGFPYYNSSYAGGYQLNFYLQNNLYWYHDGKFQEYATPITKASIGLGNVENTALSTWTGSNKITTVGTITSGTWTGTAIAVANGGTGATSAANARTNLGLGTAATKGVTDNSSNADVTSSDTNLITGRTLYYQLAKKGYTTNTGTVTSVRVQASSPLQSSVNTAQSSSLNTTISFVNQNANTILAGPSSGSAAAPTFRALVAADIPTLTLAKISDAGAAAAKAVTDNSSNADVTSTDTNLITGRTLYYQLAKKGYTTNTGTVTSVTLTSGAGITVSDSGTAITGSGSRTISITGMNTSSGSTAKCLTEKGTWASFTNNAGTVTSVQVQASGPLSSSTSTAQSSTLSTTISFSNQDPNKVLAGPSSGSSAGAPSFRALVAADIPNLSWNKITSDKPTTVAGYGITDAVSTSALSDYLALAGGTMTGTITLNNGVAMYTASDAGWSLNQYGNFTHRRTNANDYVGVIGGSGDFRVYYDSGNVSTSGYIIGGNGVYATNGILCTRGSTAWIQFQNASAQAIGEIWSQSGRIYIRERPSAGSSYITDVVFPTAKSNGNENVYVYTSRNFSLSGTTLTITVPS